MRKNKLIIFLLSSVFLSDVYAQRGFEINSQRAVGITAARNAAGGCVDQPESSYESYVEQLLGGETITERFFGNEQQCLQNAGVLSGGEVRLRNRLRAQDVRRFYNQCGYDRREISSLFPGLQELTQLTEQVNDVIDPDHIRNRDSLINAFWQNLASRSHSQIACRQRGIQFAQSNQGAWTQLAHRAEGKFDQVIDRIRELIVLKRRSAGRNGQAVRDQFGCSGPGGGSLFCYHVAQARTSNDHRLYEGAIAAELAKIPYGYESGVAEAILGMANSGSFDRDAYYASLTNTFERYDELGNYYDERFTVTEPARNGRRARGRFCIDNEFKRLATSTGVTGQLVGSLVGAGLLGEDQGNILSCRINSKYQVAGENLDTTMNIAFMVGGIAAFPLTAPAAIIGLGLSAPALVYQLGRAHQACMRRDFMISADGAEDCNPEQDFQNEISERSTSECIMEAGFAGLEALPIPFDVSTIVRSRRGIATGRLVRELDEGFDAAAAARVSDNTSPSVRPRSGSTATAARVEVPPQPIVASGRLNPDDFAISADTARGIRNDFSRDGNNIFPEETILSDEFAAALSPEQRIVFFEDLADVALTRAQAREFNDIIADGYSERSLRRVSELLEEAGGNSDNISIVATRAFDSGIVGPVPGRAAPSTGIRNPEISINYADSTRGTRGPAASVNGPDSIPARTDLVPFPNRPATQQNEILEEVTGELHSVWLARHRASGGGERLKEVPLRPGETAQQAFARYDGEYPGIKINDNGDLVQDINQQAENIIPDLNQRLNGSPAPRYSEIVYSREFDTTADIRNALDAYHVEWLRLNNGWATDVQKLPFSELPPSQQILDLEVFEAVVRTRNPDLLNSPVFRNYRNRLQRQVTEELDAAAGRVGSTASGAAARTINIDQGVANIEEAWQLTRRQMRIEGIADVPNPTPENQRRILEIFEQANSRVSTPLGATRAERRTRGGTAIVDSDALTPSIRRVDDQGEVVGTVPDYIVRRGHGADVVYDHHGVNAQRFNPETGVLEDIPAGTNSTTQILDDIVNLTPEQFNLRFGNFASDNIGDAFGLARFVAQNSDIIRANPALIQRLRAIAAQEDFSIFGLRSAVENDDQLAALLRLNDRTLENVEATYMDRVSLSFGSRTAEELERLQVDIRKIFLPLPDGDVAFIRGHADDFRDNLSRAGREIGESRTRVLDATGNDSPILLVQMDGVEDLTRGPFEGWTAVPEYVRGIEGPSQVPIERTFTFTGADSAPTRNFIFSNFSGRGQPMNTAINGMDNSFVDLMKNTERASVQRAISSGTLEGDNLVAAQTRLSQIESGEWPAGRPGQLYFGNTYMSTDEIQGFVSNPETLRSLGVEPPRSQTPAID